MNGVRIIVSDGVDFTGFITNGEDLDLYPDENIVMTLKKTDISGLETNYADLTYDFSVPATPKNKRILKYWHNVNYNGQISASNGLPSRIDLYGFYFRKGIITINNGDQNGHLKSYSVRFTSNLKSLKDSFGDKKLSELTYTSILPEIQFNYTDTYVESNIRLGENGFIEYPLVSTTRQLKDFNDLKFINASTANGIRKEELRPALKVRYFFNAIQSQYNVKFIGDFMTENPIIDRLYLWLNKNENPYANSAKILDLSGQFTNTTYYNLDATNNYFTFTANWSGTNRFRWFGFYARTGTANSTTPYKIFIQQVILNGDGTINEVATTNQDNNGFVSSSPDWVTGNSELYFKKYISSTPSGTRYSYRIAVETIGSLNLTETSVEAFTYKMQDFQSVRSALVSSADNSLINVFNIPYNIPDMTVYDFLNSIISMFKLVILPNTNPIVQTQHGNAQVFQLEYYRNYYNQNDGLDITKYVERQLKINAVKSFKKISFKYAESAYGNNILYKKNQISLLDYGNISQDIPNGNEGEYTVESKFNLLMWKELPNTYEIDEDYELNETWIVSDSLDEDFSKGVFNKPTLFFSNGSANIPSDRRIAYTNDDGTSVALTNYNIFSNVDKLDDDEYTTSLAFSTVNEFNSSLRDRNLYTNGYQNIIESIYSPYAREFDVTAVLPKHIIQQLELGTTLIIGNNNFDITEMNVNLINGRTQFKVRNIIKKIPDFIYNITLNSVTHIDTNVVAYNSTHFGYYPATVAYQWSTDGVVWSEFIGENTSPHHLGMVNNLSIDYYYRVKEVSTNTVSNVVRLSTTPKIIIDNITSTETYNPAGNTYTVYFHLENREVQNGTTIYLDYSSDGHIWTTAGINTNITTSPTIVHTLNTTVQNTKFRLKYDTYNLVSPVYTFAL